VKVILAALADWKSTRYRPEEIAAEVTKLNRLAALSFLGLGQLYAPNRAWIIMG
jgi:hypothetical protein